MEALIIACNSTPPLAPTTSSKRHPNALNSATSAQPTISFTKAHEFDANLNHLCGIGRLREAVSVLDSASKHRCTVRPDTFAHLIDSCTRANSIQLGKSVHKYIDLVSNVDPFIETKLVGMYAKCGSLNDARKVFDEMRERNLYAWSAIVGACSREGKWQEVVQLFYSMVTEDYIIPDDFLFPKILQACGKCGDIRTGELIHSITVRLGMGNEERINNAILAVYAKCGRLSSAKRFFEKMGERDTVSWNSMITGYCFKGEIEEAKRLVHLMREDGLEPGLVTWNILIASYNQLGDCDRAMEVVREIERSGITPDVITWTSMISGFSQNNRASEALELFGEMLSSGVEPNGMTLMTAISACASLKTLREGMEIHLLAIKLGFGEDVLVANSLIDMYSKCGKLESARRVFDHILEKDVYTWNSMIGGYCQSGYCGKAHDLFLIMEKSDVAPNVITWNAMITGYMRKGDEDQAMDLFQRMEREGPFKRDTASWNSLIAGYLQNGLKNKGLGIFRQMQALSVKPNSISILSVLPASGNLIASKKVREVHSCVLRRNLESDLSVANSLMDSYARSGNLLYSRTIFDRMFVKDIITWNTIVGAYVLHGRGREALDLFELMKDSGPNPNKGTFAWIITACGLTGMVDYGKDLFSYMIENYQTMPSLEHYLAMVHLFGRSGKLEEAKEFIENMPIEADFSIWYALLTACRNHSDIKMALYAAEKLLSLKPGNASVGELVSDISALCGISEDVSIVKNLSKGNEAKESLGESWLEVKNTVHTFVAGDRSKPNSEALYSWIRSVEGRIWAPDTHDGLCFDEEEREEIGGVHSEKLALAFALIGSPQEAQCIRIVKSLRVCKECHQVAKFISKTYHCEIYLSDSACLHHFKEGNCSCGDYW